MATHHVKDNGSDRKLGAYWERMFCNMASRHSGCSFTPHQLKRDGAAVAWAFRDGAWMLQVLPDVTIWSNGGEHHEIKHKEPTRDGMFGLEKYRFDSLIWFRNECNCPVMYTIHDHSRIEGRGKGRDRTENRFTDWFTVDVLQLRDCVVKRKEGMSWIAGEPKLTEILFWRTSEWMPLMHHWFPPQAFFPPQYDDDRELYWSETNDANTTPR